MSVYYPFVLGSLLFALTFIPTPASDQLSLKPQAGTPPTSDPVQLHVTVTSKQGAFVNGLKANDFEVFFDKKPAKIVSFSSQDSPASIGIVLDISGSMSRRSSKISNSEFAAIREALSQFLNMGKDDNDYFLMAFNTQPRLLVDWTSDRTRLFEGFNDIILSGNSALYDACYVAIDKLQQGRHPKRVLVVISDGEDNVSRYTFHELRDLIRTTGVLVYPIHFTGLQDDVSPHAYEARRIVRELSLLSGGATHQHVGKIKAKAMSMALRLISAELRHQYSISILASAETPGRKWHQIKVRVKPDSVTSKETANTRVRTRQGSY